VTEHFEVDYKTHVGAYDWIDGGKWDNIFDARDCVDYWVSRNAVMTRIVKVTREVVK
jgi:hypothetical protein